MKILIFSLGTRGDTEPLLAIGEIMKNRGHEVVCALPEEFREDALESNFTFITLGDEFKKMVDSKLGKQIMGGEISRIFGFISYLKFYKKYIPTHEILINRQADIVKTVAPDRIIHSGLAFYPFIWEFQNKNKSILALPVPHMIHKVKDQAHVIFNTDWGPTINKLTYDVTNFGINYIIKHSAKNLKPPIRLSYKKLSQSLLSYKTLYFISTSLFTQPEYWNENAKVLGFHERNKNKSWKPPTDLQYFLGQHDRLLFFTFGSMTNNAPDRKTQIILNILEKHNIPAILNTASGGLVRPVEYNTNLFHFVSYIPYEWILPKMYGMVHHGGSGTTHAALKYGCASLILPHIFDQHTWNKIIARKGLGPEGISISKISENNLELKILELFNNPTFKQKAKEIAQKMKMENYKDELCDFIVDDKL